MGVLHLSLPVTDLAAAKAFYVSALGCKTGRERDRWCDVWFFGLQLTLHERPDEVLPHDERGVRHFGVTLDDPEGFAARIDRLRRHDVAWIEEPTAHAATELSGKVAAKIADPSGNVIELKYYDDLDALHHG